MSEPREQTMDYEELKKRRNEARKLRDKAKACGNLVVERVQQHRYQLYCGLIKDKFRKL